MVLADLGSKIAVALRKMTQTTIIDQTVMNEMLSEICGPHGVPRSLGGTYEPPPDDAVTEEAPQGADGSESARDDAYAWSTVSIDAGKLHKVVVDVPAPSAAEGRKLAAARYFVDVGRQHQIRRDADLGKQIQSPRRGGSKDKLVVCGGHLAPFIRRGTARAALGGRPT